MSDKTRQFRSMLDSPGLEFILEAHNGLSARIVEAAGFCGIWGSGLSIATALGVRDSNEASWTQVLEVIEFMSEVTTIPILLDADTGYGDFNNVRRLVRKLEQRSVAAMCLEDKLYPKKNSLLTGAAQPLADIGEFTGKLKAAKDTQSDSYFSVVARTEAFIAGRGLNEALERAEIYADAGADAIVVHSRQRSPAEIFAFMDKWDGRCPVVIIPTRYYDTPAERFASAGISLVIWANHLMRACVAAMEATAGRIHAVSSVASLETEIASVDHIFAMYDYEELSQAEKRYAPDCYDIKSRSVLNSEQQPVRAVQ